MKRIVTLATCLALAAPLAAQEQPAQNEIPAQDDASMGKMLEHADADRAAAKLGDHDARMALQHYGSCVADSATGGDDT